MDVNVEHVPGAQSIYEVQSSQQGAGAGYWQGRGAAPAAQPGAASSGVPAAAKLPPMNITINVPERSDARDIAGQVSSIVRNTAPALGYSSQIGVS